MTTMTRSGVEMIVSNEVTGAKKDASDDEEGQEEVAVHNGAVSRPKHLQSRNTGFLASDCPSAVCQKRRQLLALKLVPRAQCCHKPLDAPAYPIQVVAHGVTPAPGR